MPERHASPAAPGNGVPAATLPRPRRDLRGDRRRDEILELLNADATSNVTVGDLAERFAVSEATIRRDLSQLEGCRLITRTYGGAALSNLPAEPSMPQRESSHADAKRAIGRTAAALIEDDDLVILDAGSTTEQLAVAIGNRPVSVVTNGLRVINRLASFTHARVLVLGGALRGFNETISGPDAEAMLSRFYARFAFIGGDGVHPLLGIASRTYEQSRIKSLMMARAEAVFVVADSSKLTDERFPYWSTLPEKWGLITDDGADPAALAALREAGATDIITTWNPE